MWPVREGSSRLVPAVAWCAVCADHVRARPRGCDTCGLPTLAHPDGDSCQPGPVPPIQGLLAVSPDFAPNISTHTAPSPGTTRNLGQELMIVGRGGGEPLRADPHWTVWPQVWPRTGGPSYQNQRLANDSGPGVPLHREVILGGFKPANQRLASHGWASSPDSAAFGRYLCHNSGEAMTNPPSIGGRSRDRRTPSFEHA